MYGIIHKMFIQAMMCRKIVPWEDAKQLLKNILDELPDEDQNIKLQPIIDEVNDRLRDSKMQLKDHICEVTKQRYCVLVITVETYVARLSNRFSPNEMQLFNKIMEEIITSGNGYVYLNTCINFNNNLPEDMSKSHAETVIRKFLTEEWLIEGDKGMIYLGARCISEMEPMIKDVYESYVGNCPLCQRLAIVGEKCDACHCRVHFHCLERYRKGKDVGSNKCLGCGVDWNDSSGSSDD